MSDFGSELERNEALFTRAIAERDTARGEVLGLTQQLAVVTAERDEAQKFLRDLSQRSGCWQHGEKPNEWCANCGAMGAVVAARDKAEAELASIDARLARRPALEDLSSRADKIERACAEAAKTDALRRDLARRVDMHDADGKALLAARVDVAALRAALKRIQFAAGDDCDQCRECSAPEREGHREGCVVAVALAAPNPGSGWVSPDEHAKAVSASAAYREELEAGMAGGSDGMHGRRCRCLWHESVRKTLASTDPGAELLADVRKADDEVRAFINGRLFDAIAHGNEEHRAWLREKLRAVADEFALATLERWAP